MIAADFSNYARVPTPADIAALKALGVTRVVVGTSFGDHWQQQIDVCEAAGFEVQEYQFAFHVHNTPRVWWLDVELAETVDDIRAAIRAWKPDGIYTRRGIWDLLGVDLVSEFPGLKLWDANYGPLPRTFTPYGGWTAPTMVQYHDTMDIVTGFEVDLSVYEEEHMPTAEYDELKQGDKDIETTMVLLNKGLEKQLADLQVGVDFLIKVVNNLAPRVTAVEKK